MTTPMGPDSQANTEALRIGKLTLGAALRSRRQDADLRLKDVAAALGVTVAHVSDVERGRRTPSLELLLAWSTLLGTTVRNLTRSAYPWDRVERPELADPPPDGRRRPGTPSAGL